MPYSNIIGLFFVLWVLFGACWIIFYDVMDILDYKKLTIFIGGPIWWIKAIFECLANERIVKIFRPRKKDD